MIAFLFLKKVLRNLIILFNIYSKNDKIKNIEIMYRCSKYKKEFNIFYQNRRDRYRGKCGEN